MESVALTPPVITSLNNIQTLVLYAALAFIAVVLLIFILRSRRKPDAEAPIFRVMPWPGLAERLARSMADTSRELSRGALSYLRVALLPDRTSEWFPIKFGALVAGAVAHPIEVIRGTLAADPIGATRRRRFLPILAILAVVYLGMGAYVAYLAFFSQFAHLRVVDNKNYKKFDADKLLTKLTYPPQMLRMPTSRETLSLEEIRARAEKRKKEMELARAKAEAEQKRKEKEEADRKAAEEAAKLAAQNNAATRPKPTDINIAPIKDIIANLYKLFDAGGLDIPQMRFHMMAGFKVMPDGSFEEIRIMPNGSSGSKIIDRNALEILSNLGESHALSQVSELSSATISLDITDEIARIRIVAFAPTPEIAKAKADLLSVLFWALRMKEKSPDLGQLLKMIKVTSDGKRVDTDLIVPRERAAEMFRAWSASTASPQR